MASRPAAERVSGEQEMSKVWFITGSSRGLGRALAEAALEQGDRVIAAARKPDAFDDLRARYGDRLLPVALDVTDPKKAGTAVKAGMDAFGRIDVLVNNAGYGFFGAFEEMSADDFRAQIDTNFWGVVHVTRAALPLLREQGSGHIIQITSTGGRHAVPGLSAYHAAKFAVEGFSEALAQEIKPLGIKLTIVEPGGFRTDWAGASMGYAAPLEAYRPSVGAMRDFLQPYAGQEPGDPRKAAEVILEIAGTPDAPLRLPLGNDALAVLRQGYNSSAEELERWAHLARSTDFDGLAVSDVDHAVLKLNSA
jgi:NAD(P)-dependent dehydrogenase (short-subunit alcohol dehydrogenase family)